jgi:hypothetical protein
MQRWRLWFLWDLIWVVGAATDDLCGGDFLRLLVWGGGGGDQAAMSRKSGSDTILAKVVFRLNDLPPGSLASCLYRMEADQDTVQETNTVLEYYSIYGMS